MRVLELIRDVQRGGLQCKGLLASKSVGPLIHSRNDFRHEEFSQNLYMVSLTPRTYGSSETINLADLIFCDSEMKHGGNEEHAKNSPAQSASTTPPTARTRRGQLEDKRKNKTTFYSPRPRRSDSVRAPRPPILAPLAHTKKSVGTKHRKHTSCRPRRSSHYGGTRTKEKNRYTTSSFRTPLLLL